MKASLVDLGGVLTRFLHRRYVISSLEPRLLLAAGDLDLSFAGGGVLQGPPGTAGAVVVDVGPGSGGRIYIVAETVTGGQSDLSIGRAFAGTGQPDLGFSTDGNVTVDLGGEERPVAAGLLTDGRLLVLGESIDGQGNRTTFLVRYLADGRRDLLFGSNGFFYFAPGFFGLSMVLTPQNDAVIGGGFGLLGDGSAAIARVVIDGLPDPNFGSQGIVSVTASFGSAVSDVAIQGAGIVAIGDPISSPVVGRFFGDGTLDSAFGIRPITEFTGGGVALELQSDGSILVMGLNAAGTLALRRLTPTGNFDATFAAGVPLDTGVPVQFFTGALSLAVGPLDSIVVAGDGPGGALNGVTITRFDADGAPDLTFSGDGITSFSASIGPFFPRAIALQPPPLGAPIGSAPNILVVGGTTAENDGLLTAVRIQGFTAPPFAEIDSRTGQLNLTATTAADNVSIGIAGGTSLVAQLGPDQLFFPNSAVTEIQINTGDGPDVVSIAPGFDRPLFILLGGGNNQLNAGSAVGSITVRGGGGRDSIFAGIGDDLIQTFGNGDQIFGNAGNDTIEGSSGGDTTDGGPGNDSIVGGDGFDQLNGGDDNDTLFGRAGNDQLMGGPGADRLDGEVGDDALMGGGGNDLVFGGVGNDELSGSTGSDTLDAGDGNDRVFGGDADDSISGGFGSDTLDGQSGNDALFGGDGNDLLLGNDANSETLVGGPGFDIARVDGSDVLQTIELRYRFVISN